MYLQYSAVHILVGVPTLESCNKKNSHILTAKKYELKKSILTLGRKHPEADATYGLPVLNKCQVLVFRVEH